MNREVTISYNIICYVCNHSSNVEYPDEGCPHCGHYDFEIYSENKVQVNTQKLNTGPFTPKFSSKYKK